MTILTFPIPIGLTSAQIHRIRPSTRLNNRMTAQIVFADPADVNPAIADLIKLDFDVRFLDGWVDEAGPAVWILASTITGLDESTFFSRMMAIAEPLGGDVLEVEAGLDWDKAVAWWNARLAAFDAAICNKAN